MVNTACQIKLVAWRGTCSLPSFNNSADEECLNRMVYGY